METVPIGGGELVRQGNGRELRGVQYLVGIGVANPAQDARIGEGAFESAVFHGESGTKCFRVAGENVDAAGIDGWQIFIAEDMQRRTTFGACLCENEGSVGEIEGCKILSSAEFCVWQSPMQTSGNHEMKNQPQIILQAYGDAFTDSLQLRHFLPLDIGKRRAHGAQEEDVG